MSNLVKKSDFLSPNFLKDFFEDEIFTDRFLRKRVMPPVNVSEDKENYQIDVSVPGIKKENIKVSYKERLLTISYEQEHSNEQKEKNYHKQEFQSQSFMRSFTIPKDVNIEKITSEHKDGLLVIHLPKIEISKREESIDIEIK